jgi:FixJ family two-component response regulator/CRP-like cAMP-binding protein
MSEAAGMVCVIDDDESVRKALASLIRSVGLEVKAFTNAREYLEWQQADIPSCLVLDVRLPGKSGLELQRELVESKVQVPIIFVTGHGDIPMSVRAMKAGAVEFLTKPFRDQDLLDAIQTSLQQAWAARSANMRRDKEFRALPFLRKPDAQMIRPRVDTQIDGNPLRNTLLLSLPVEECQLLFPRLTFIPLRTNDVLHEAGESIKYGYFINDGLVSSLSVMEDGRSVEVASLGREGFLGAPLLVGFQSSPGQTIVQIQGAGYRIPAHALIELLPRCPVLSKILQRYAQISGLQSAQTAACNRLHQVEQRLARWLLMCQDKISSNFVPLTQESLAQLLGARRSSVTVAAGLFQTTGLISYSPGQVELLNRPGLEEAACECYGAMVQQASKWNRESA